MSFTHHAFLFATAAAAACAAAATLTLIATRASSNRPRDKRLAYATHHGSRPLTAYGRHARRKY